MYGAIEAGKACETRRDETVRCHSRWRMTESRRQTADGRQKKRKRKKSKRETRDERQEKVGGQIYTACVYRVCTKGGKHTDRSPLVFLRFCVLLCLCGLSRGSVLESESRSETSTRGLGDLWACVHRWVLDVSEEPRTKNLGPGNQEPGD